MRFGFGSRLALAGLMAALAQGASAATINVQFGETSTVFGPTPHYTGSAVVGDADDLCNFAGGTFNPDYLSPDTSGWGRTINGLSLLDIDGNATGASLSLATPDAFISLQGFAPIFKGTAYEALMDSFVFADDDRLGQGGGGDGAGTITISGLKAGASYELFLLSAGDVIGRATRFTLGGVDKLATPSGAQSFIDGDTYVSFLTNADAGGSLSFTFDAGNGIEGDLNGFQLVERNRALPEPSPAPEPATWALFIVGFGLVGTTVRARRSGRAARA